jgi:hypothetical protein
VIALEDERARQPAEQPGAQRGALLAERGGCLLKQLDHALIGDPGPPAGLLVADRGTGEQLPVTQVAGDLRGGGERLERIRGVPGAMAGGAELEEQLRALGGAVDLQLQRGAQPRRRLVVGDRVGGGPRGPHVVLHGALRRADRCGRREVVREVRERAARPLLGALEGLGDAQVELGAAQPGEAVVERAAHELMREPVAQPVRRKLTDHAAADRLVEGGEQVGLAQAGSPAHDVEAELRPGGGRELQEVRGRGRQAGEPLVDDLAHALRRSELGKRSGGPDRAVGDLDDARLHQRAPQLADQERVASGEL